MAEITCPDLKELFGKRYRITTDPVATRQNTDPWLWVIPCKFKGEIYPAGVNDLMVMFKTNSKVTRELRTLPELRVHQDATDFVVFRFHVDHFAKVAKLVGAKRKRQMSPEVRENAVKQGTANLKKINSDRLNATKIGKIRRAEAGKGKEAHA